MNSFRKVVVVAAALLLSFALAVPVSADESYVEYTSLTSTGSQYIDSGVVLNNNSRVVVDFQFDPGTSSMGTLFGAISYVSARVQAYTLSYSSGHFQLNVGDNAKLDMTSAYKVGELNTLDVDFMQSNVALNGTNFAFSVPDLSRGYENIFIFAANNGGSPLSFSSSTIYSFRIYDNGTLIRSFVPASVDGVNGFYDLVNDSFYNNLGTGVFSVGDVVVHPPDEPTVAEQISALNTQIHDIESAIYDDLHTYSAQVDPSTATNFSGNFLSAMSFISDTWTSAYGQLGDMQVIVTFPLFLAIAMLFIGRMNSVIASGAMKSKKNNDKKGGGDVG